MQGMDICRLGDKAVRTLLVAIHPFPMHTEHRQQLAQEPPACNLTLHQQRLLLQTSSSVKHFVLPTVQTCRLLLCYKSRKYTVSSSVRVVLNKSILSDTQLISSSFREAHRKGVSLLDGK